MNVAPGDWFSASRGSRQRVSLSSFLLTLVVDILSRMLDRGVRTRLIEGSIVGRDGAQVSHFQFADDTILSGMKINLSECGLASINVDHA